MASLRRHPTTCSLHVPTCWGSRISPQLLEKSNSSWTVFIYTEQIWRIVSSPMSPCTNYSSQAAISWLSHHLGWIVWPQSEPELFATWLWLCAVGSLKNWLPPPPWRFSGCAVRPAYLLGLLRRFEWEEASFKGRLGCAILFRVLTENVFNIVNHKERR